MKKIGQIMQELGFRPEGSTATKEAFIKHLLRAAEGVNVMTPTEVEVIEKNRHLISRLDQHSSTKTGNPVPVQLSFDFLTERSKKDSA